MNSTSQLFSQRLPPKGVFWSEGVKRRTLLWLEMLTGPSCGKDTLLSHGGDAAGAAAAKVSLGSAPPPAQLPG